MADRKDDNTLIPIFGRGWNLATTAVTETGNP